ncbi:MAG: hypothetical protein Q8P67_12650 [archaeon]|nr:hypothetical protein [archaeon]
MIGIAIIIIIIIWIRYRYPPDPVSWMTSPPPTPGAVCHPPSLLNKSYERSSPESSLSTSPRRPVSRMSSLDQAIKRSWLQ